MSHELAGALAWWNDASPAMTAIGGGVMALASSLLLFLVALALGPDVHVFPCLDARARFWAFLTAFAWFVRGVMILTSMHGPEARHPHWDVPASWFMTTVLLGLILGYVWAQRMPPSVRQRFDRRERFKRQRAQVLVRQGRIGEAVMVAAGLGRHVHAVGLDPETTRRLSEL